MMILINFSRKKKLLFCAYFLIHLMIVINFQDQYREEEIEEFRELQRELEQNAKNCRILQFKLRKSERTREEMDAKKQHLEAKVKVSQLNASSLIVIIIFIN